MLPKLYHQWIDWVGDGTGLPDTILHIHAGMALLMIALASVIAWWIINPANILPAATAVLIVACPCSLLLSATFTYGNMLRIFGKNK